ncbi:MAG: CDP-diacylglycerol--glycerol-3-phosphate 3-phosphatidyltransferase [Bacilli bacterium]|jgi:CDP-diacylglycerol--glycerol-3-phosphate 3-phosphatidyltransferase
MSKMNLPNKLTLLRILMIPIIVIIPMITSLDVNFFSEVTLSNFIILIVFCIASFTDFLDGYIARKNNLVTDFGKFMDPLADKLLVFAAFIVLVELGRIEGWIVTVIIAREFMVTGIRILAANNDMVISASKLGKLKTISQMVTIIVLLLNNFPFALIDLPVGIILTYIAAALTVVSGVDYFIKNKEIILKSK